MSRHEQEVLSTVAMRGKVSVQELAEALGVSDQTIRRIVRPMAERGEVKKVHGAIIAARPSTDPPYLARMNLNREAKVAIARTVAGIIGDGASLVIDAGSTSSFVAQALRVREDLTVVTNSAFVASTLAMVESNKVFMAGTQLRHHDGAAFDRAAFSQIEAMKVDFAILSASFADPARGFMVFEQCEVDIAAAMKAIASRAIFAVDHSKFEAESPRPSLVLPPLGAADIVVTDRPPPANFELLLAEPEIRIATDRTETSE